MSVSLLLALSVAATPGPATFELTRARATKAYKARQFKRACSLYARAVKLEPEDAAVRVDLGQCLVRLGKKSKAAAARESARAVFLARPNREPLQPSDEQTRKAAYLNLFALGQRLEVPRPGACLPLPQAPECPRAVHACGAYFNEHGSAGGVSGEAVRLALSPTAAAVSADAAPEGLLVDRTTVTDFLPRADGQEGPEPAAPASLVLVSEADELTASCAAGPCDARLSALTDTHCALVLADACSGVVGVVCETRERGTKARPEQRWGEMLLTEPPSP